jgi:hypothetical protein
MADALFLALLAFPSELAPPGKFGTLTLILLTKLAFEHVFVARWDANWKAMICDRSQPIELRLTRFYTEYADRIFDACWIRIFMFAGLKGHPMTNRYVSHIRNQLIGPGCNELRAEPRLPISSIAMTRREEEAFWALHGAVFYLGIRTFIYGVRTSPNRAEVVRDQVQTFLAGAPRILRESLRDGEAGTRQR